MTGPIHDHCEETVTVCPECDSASIRRRTPSHPSSRATQTHLWACLDCTAGFDEPAERVKKNRGGRPGLAGRLVDADPDAIGGD